jgi:hypothetical protein
MASWCCCCWCGGWCSLSSWCCSTIFAFAFALSLAFALWCRVVGGLGLCSPWDNGVVDVLSQLSERSTGIINNWNWDGKWIGSSTDWVRNWIGWAANSNGVSWTSVSSWWWSTWAGTSSGRTASWRTAASTCRVISIEVIGNISSYFRIAYAVAR